MKERNTKPPAGTRDFLPSEARFRKEVLDIVTNVIKSYGFEPLETPAFERIETLMGKYGEESQKLLFKILKRGGKEAEGEVDFALRYDFTVPLARVIGEYRNELPKIFKRYQVGPVWRADRPGKGRFREFYQYDIDIVGSTSLAADAEVITVFSDVLTKLGITDFIIRLNSRRVLWGLTEICGIPKHLQIDFLIVLDKLDKIGLNGVVGELDKRGIPLEGFTRLVQGGNKDDHTTVMTALRSSVVGCEGISEVQELKGYLGDVLQKGMVTLDPFLARGLDYYTGPIFEINVKGFNGSVAGGGRYDELIRMFLPNNIPACGGSLGVERILLILKDKKRDEKLMSPTQVMIAVWGEDYRRDAFALAAQLRKHGLFVEMYLGKDKINQQIGYASQRGIRFVIISGPDEKMKSAVTLKNLQTGEQRSILENELISTLQNEFGKEGR